MFNWFRKKSTPPTQPRESELFQFLQGLFARETYHHIFDRETIRFFFKNNLVVSIEADLKTVSVYNTETQSFIYYFDSFSKHRIPEDVKEFFRNRKEHKEYTNINETIKDKYITSYTKNIG
jgi:hypothetical protein